MAARTQRRSKPKRERTQKPVLTKQQVDTLEKRVDRHLGKHLKSSAFASTVQEVFEARLRKEVDREMNQQIRQIADGYTSLFLACGHCNRNSIVMVPNSELINLRGRKLACPICGRL